MVADEAVLALVDFPKQVVVAFSVAVEYMKGTLMLHTPWTSDSDRQVSVYKTLSAIAHLSPKYVHRL